MKLWKARGRVFIKQGSDRFHHIILLKTEIWKLRSISWCIRKPLPIFEISKTVKWIFHGQSVIWSAGTAWQITLSLWKKVYIQPKMNAQIFLLELWNSVKKQKPATNNSNKNGAILSPQIGATVPLPSTCQTARTHLYMANQETLFEPMKRIQMDSNHQLKINVSDK